MERKVGVGLFRQSLDVLMNWGQGLVGRVWETGEPLVVNNYAAWPARTPVPGIRENSIHAVVGDAPEIRTRCRRCHRPGLHHASRSAPSATATSSFSTASRNSPPSRWTTRNSSPRLNNARCRSRPSIAPTRNFTATSNSPMFCKRWSDVAVDILKADKSVLLTWNEAKTHLVPRASRGFQPETLEHDVVRTDQGLVGYVATTRRAGHCQGHYSRQPRRLEHHLPGAHPLLYARPHHRR